MSIFAKANWLISLMIKNEIAKTTYYYGTVQKCYEKDCKEILIYLKKYFLCLLSVFC